jgi:hypothetical protein
MLLLRTTTDKGQNIMLTVSHKSPVYKYIELWNTGNLALADEVLALDFVDHSHPEFSPARPCERQTGRC